MVNYGQLNLNPNNASHFCMLVNEGMAVRSKHIVPTYLWSGNLCYGFLLVFLIEIQKSLNIHDWRGCLNMDVAVNAS